MLRLELKEREFYNEAENRFITKKARILMLEHSLVSVSRWESKWKVSFFDEKDKTVEQSLDYIACMDTNGQLTTEDLTGLPADVIQKVNDYISDPMTATTITQRGPKKRSSEKVTSELIYFWMTQFGIDMRCEKWHLNRLLTLIEVCSVKSGPQQKMGRKEQMAQQRALNNARRAQLKTKG